MKPAWLMPPGTWSLISSPGGPLVLEDLREDFSHATARHTVEVSVPSSRDGAERCLACTLGTDLPLCQTGAVRAACVWITGSFAHMGRGRGRGGGGDSAPASRTRHVCHCFGSVETWKLQVVCVYAEPGWLRAGPLRRGSRHRDTASERFVRSDRNSPGGTKCHERGDQGVRRTSTSYGSILGEGTSTAAPEMSDRT
ncbi:hypothetical protein BD413DRAFT_533429 [Trametes elegans]|nr:hypothetical protein BD413DRAFT_533429 [Trametes elegans]